MPLRRILAATENANRRICVIKGVGIDLPDVSYIFGQSAVVLYVHGHCQSNFGKGTGFIAFSSATNRGENATTFRGFLFASWNNLMADQRNL